MIDLHNHIIPCIDDGSASIAESIEIAKEALASGFTGIFCTSHFAEELFLEREDNELYLNDLRKALKNENINIELYSGNEVFISSDILEWLKENKFQTLNKGKYFLMELPMHTTNISYLNDLIYDITNEGYIPIFAHPERYTFVQENPNALIELINSGALFQMNYGSLIGFYGKSAQKAAAILLKNNMIHFLATDNHRKKTIYRKMDEIILKVKKIIDDDTFEILTRVNAERVLKNLDIIADSPKPYKRFIFY